jgi:hypothetical protein
VILSITLGSNKPYLLPKGRHLANHGSIRSNKRASNGGSAKSSDRRIWGRETATHESAWHFEKHDPQIISIFEFGVIFSSLSENDTIRNFVPANAGPEKKLTQKGLSNRGAHDMQMHRCSFVVRSTEQQSTLIEFRPLPVE